MAKNALVAGCGIVGISSAIWLQRAGYDVTIVDRKGPAAGASFGNAGVLASGSLIPVTVPGLMRKAPKMLFSKDGPLFLKWKHIVKLAPFLAQYLRYATPEHVERYASAMATLLHDTHQQHSELAKGTKAAKFIGDADYCLAYSTREAFDADRKFWDVRGRNGVKFTEVTGDDFSAFDPVYANKFGTVIRCHSHGAISDPGAYINALVDDFKDKGGKLEIIDITGLIREGPSILGLKTDQGDMRADETVLALGAWSGPMMKELGVKVHVEAERGYHIELVNPSQMPKLPVMITAKKFVVSPMDGRIRLAGVVEFSDVDAPASNAPLELLKRQAETFFKDITFDRVDTWVGPRPTTANSLPIIGKPVGMQGVTIGFGHQHVGLTGGPKTGRILASMILGDRPNIDLSPFDPAQYL